MATKTEIWTADDGTDHPNEAAAVSHDERVAFARRFVAEQRPGMKATGRVDAEVARLAKALAMWEVRDVPPFDEAAAD